MEITENKLYSIIEKYVRYYLNEKYIINEMAIEKHMFFTKCENIINVLVDHSLLLAYCSTHDKENQNFNHWKKEVTGFCKPLTTYNLKGFSKNKQCTIKERLLKQAWISDFEMLSNKVMADYWYAISKEKNINFSITNNMKSKYIEIINNIIHYISNSNMRGLIDYINII